MNNAVLELYSKEIVEIDKKYVYIITNVQHIK